MVNHVSGQRSGVAGIYNRHSSADEKRTTLQAWADRLDATVSGQETPGNVVALRHGGDYVALEDAHIANRPRSIRVKSDRTNALSRLLRSRCVYDEIRLELLLLCCRSEARDLVTRPEPAHAALRLLGGALLVQCHNPAQDLLVSQAFRPAIGTQHGRIEPVVQLLQDQDEAGVACVVRSFRRLLLALACDAIIQPQRRSRLKQALAQSIQALRPDMAPGVGGRGCTRSGRL